MLLSAAYALAAPPFWRDAGEWSNSEELERESIQTYYDTLKDLITGAGEFGNRVLDGDQETLLALLGRLKEITLSNVGGKELSSETRNKKQFLAVLDVLEELTSYHSNKAELTDSDKRDVETFLAIIDQTRAAVRAQPDDAPPSWPDFQPVLRQLLELARARGAAEQDIHKFLAIFKSVMANL